MQAMLDAEFGKDSAGEEEEEVYSTVGSANSTTCATQHTDDDIDLFCPACNKVFKSSKS